MSRACVRDPHRVHLVPYHLIWCPKRRKPVLTGAVAARLRDVLAEVVTEQGWAVENLTVMPDHLWAFGQLGAFVEYKARLAGVKVVFVDPRNTSRTCPACGCIDRANRLSQAVFSCVSCGHAANADHNAARVIATRAGQPGHAAQRLAPVSSCRKGRDNPPSLDGSS